MKSVSLLLACGMCLSCSSAPPSRPTVPPPDGVYDLSWRDMVVDRPSCAAYAGKVVRFTLLRKSRAIEGNTVRVWYGDKNVPPTMILHCPEQPTDDAAWVVKGTVRELVVDGQRRGPSIDFFVEVDVTSVTPVAAPKH